MYLQFKIKNHRLESSGFTLIEIIAVLVILGILSAFLMAGYINSVKSHVDSSQNYAEIQKAQAALLRITLEMQNSSSISTASNIISYTYTPDSKARTISLSGNTLRIYRDSDKTYHTLTDNVVSGTGFTASLSSKLLSLTLTVNLSNNITKTFTTAVYIP